MERLGFAGGKKEKEKKNAKKSFLNSCKNLQIRNAYKDAS